MNQLLMANKPVKRRQRRYKCELCEQPRLTSRHHTICEPCDAELKRTQDAERAANTKHRKCRLCAGYMEPSRYFSCKQCVPDHMVESEDVVWDGVDSIGYGAESNDYDSDEHPTRFQPKLVQETEKRCTRCHETKSIDQFSVYNRNRPNRRRNLCAPCYVIDSREVRARMKDRRKESA